MDYILKMMDFRPPPEAAHAEHPHCRCIAGGGGGRGDRHVCAAFTNQQARKSCHVLIYQSPACFTDLDLGARDPQLREEGQR